jgi:hypothetical protein
MPRAAPVLLLLAALLALLPPPGARAQEPPGPPAVQSTRGFRLEQNYPNPANPDTYIPFYLEESLFANGESRVVSIRIVNLLGQLIAVPRAVGHPRGPSVSVDNLRYTEPGRKQAYWDGRDINGRRAPSAVYYCILVVDGQTAYMKFLMAAPRRRGRIFPFFRRGD